jgi:hypothetical protein
MYHAIGKDRWDQLPGLFQNSALADQLDADTEWWCWTNMFPSISQPGRTCTVDLKISFRKSDGSFKKTYNVVGTE